MDIVVYSFLITILAGLATMVGSILIFFEFKDTKKIISGSLAFAAGVMLTISITDLIPSSILGFGTYYYIIPTIILTIIFIIIGILISTAINKLMPNIGTYEINNKALYKVGIVSMIAIVLHNVPEGIATFMASTRDLSLGISLALAISMHNIPEGISISIPIYYSTKSKCRALFYTFISGVSEPFGAVLAYLFLAPYVNEFIMSSLFAIIAGIMIAISIYELLPTSLKYRKIGISVFFFLIGILFMSICHIII